MALEILWWLFGIICGMCFFIVLVTVKRDILAGLILNEVARDAVKRKKDEIEESSQ